MGPVLGGVAAALPRSARRGGAGGRRCARAQYHQRDVRGARPGPVVDNDGPRWFERPRIGGFPGFWAPVFSRCGGARIRAGTVVGRRPPDWRSLVRAFVITGPRAAEVREVPVPEPRAGEVVVDVKLAGVCGTDEEFWTGDMAYLHVGHASYPLRPGHEWTGNITELGPGVAADWRGKRVTGDTMLGCGDCARCRADKHHVCSRRFEVGIRGGFPGALAQKIVMPIHALHEIPAAVDDVAAALVEPGGNALRTALACDPQPGKRVLIWGPDRKSVV